MDELDHRAVRMYTFFDPELKQTLLGSYIIFVANEKARRLKFAFVFLGIGQRTAIKCAIHGFPTHWKYCRDRWVLFHLTRLNKP